MADIICSHFPVLSTNVSQLGPRLVYCSFLALGAMWVVFCMKNWRSKNLSTSSRRLRGVSMSLAGGEVERNLHDGRTDDNDCLPLGGVHGQDVKQALQDGSVEQGKVQSH